MTQKRCALGRDLVTAFLEHAPSAQAVFANYWAAAVGTVSSPSSASLPLDPPPRPPQRPQLARGHYEELLQALKQ
jgi:hypothetical protein